MSRKQKTDELEVIRLTNLSQLVEHAVTITNVGEADVRMLAEGVVPLWLQKDAEFWCRDNPKPSDINPAFREEKAEDLARMVGQ